MKKNILVAGGAGYIGSHMVLFLLDKGYEPIIYDNLSEGHQESILGGKFIQGDLADTAKLHQVFNDYDISAVMHFAAHCYVGESVTNPKKYYQNNVFNAYNLLNVMLEHKVNKFIFSSTCATYGNPIKLPLTEDHPQNPINPYGNTKLVVEKILHDYSHAYDLKSIALRYFNASGAEPQARIGEGHDPETHLIPNVLDAALGLKELKIFGDDYDTPDGTCIRDYIHVMDLAQAHWLALEKLLDGHQTDFFNLGTGTGYSNKEVIQAAEKVTGKKISVSIVERRAGDPPSLVGSSDKAKKELGWKPEYDSLEKIIETAWKWHLKLRKIN
ncbi:MAG: UDP-glucose 4-epimerase GalE [Candidatus Sericytochromatia bacterium]|nr:UDP-glucose 4-epimerase GalE [Candidatus Sericytochromatia bacterium]